MDNNGYGVITEQGDLGLGFELLNDKDQKVYAEAVNKEKNDKKASTTVINEKKN